MQSQRVERLRHVLGNSSRQIELALGDGVTKPEAVGMEGLAIDQSRVGGQFVRLRRVVKVLQVAKRQEIAPRVELVGHYGMADVVQMDPNLVGAAALRLAAHQGEVAESFLDLIKRQRFLAAVRGGADGHLLACDWMKADRLLNVVAMAIGDSVDNRQIFLVDFTMLELLGQPAMRQFILDRKSVV